MLEFGNKSFGFKGGSRKEHLVLDKIMIFVTIWSFPNLPDYSPDRSPFLSSLLFSSTEPIFLFCLIPYIWDITAVCYLLSLMGESYSSFLKHPVFYPVTHKNFPEEYMETLYKINQVETSFISNTVKDQYFVHLIFSLVWNDTLKNMTKIS